MFEQIISDLYNEDLNIRFRAIRNLPKLDPDFSIQIINKIFFQNHNLSMKLECLRILPILINNNNVKYYKNTIKNLFKDNDNEVIRNILLTLQQIDHSLIDRSLIIQIINLLSSKDTDIQFLAIKTLKHFKVKLSVDEIKLNILPLINHENIYIRNIVKELLEEIDYTSN